MPVFDWKAALFDAVKITAHQAESSVDTAVRRLKKRMGWLRPVHILPYRGFGNERELYLLGRVLERRNVAGPQDDHTAWDNIRYMYRRFRTAEIPDCRVQARFQGRTVETLTDAEGYYELRMPLSDTPLDQERLWHQVELELLDEIVPDQGKVTTTGEVLVPPRDSAFGVISDVDDTIVKSHATDLLKLIRITLLHNARTRMMLPGVGAFYRALQRGPTGEMLNPFFYVSSSAWNLYDLLADFLDHNGIPAGPILLRDLGFDRDKFIKTGHSHKLEKIEQILSICAGLNFVLIGDEGQKDAQIYRQVVLDFPGRVRVIYIREVSWKDRSQQIDDIARELRDHGVEMLLIKDSAAAARHAIETGLIAPEEAAPIHADREQDTSSPDRVEQ